MNTSEKNETKAIHRITVRASNSVMIESVFFDVSR